MAGGQHGKATPRKRKVGASAGVAKQIAGRVDVSMAPDRFAAAVTADLLPPVASRRARPHLQQVVLQSPPQPTRKSAQSSAVVAAEKLRVKTKASPQTSHPQRAHAHRARSAAQSVPLPAIRPQPATAPQPQLAQRPQLPRDNPALIVRFDDSSDDEGGGSGYDSHGRRPHHAQPLSQNQAPPARPGRLSVSAPRSAAVPEQLRTGSVGALRIKEALAQPLGKPTNAAGKDVLAAIR